MLLAVNKAQLSPAPGWETQNIPGSGDFWDKDLPSSSHPTERTRRGRGRTEDTWFVVWFKEHLNLSKDLGPGVAGGAAGSARTRHGRFLCAFLKGRGGGEPSQPWPLLENLSAPRGGNYLGEQLPANSLCSQRGWRRGGRVTSRGAAAGACGEGAWPKPGTSCLPLQGSPEGQSRASCKERDSH